jgi:L-threonylcarbamoyladenylate synthase
MTEIMPAHGAKALKRACFWLREGDIIALPTDTGYALAANPFERFAVRQLLDLASLPLTLIITQVDDLNQVARRVPGRVWPLLQSLWPGPLWVMLPQNPKLPPEVTGGQATVTARLPDHPVCVALATAFGRPLAVTAGALPALAPELAAHFGPELALVLDGGPQAVASPPPMLDLSVDPPRLVQPGELEPDQLRQFLPDLQA